MANSSVSSISTTQLLVSHTLNHYHLTYPQNPLELPSSFNFQVTLLARYINATKINAKFLLAQNQEERINIIQSTLQELEQQQTLWKRLSFQESSL